MTPDAASALKLRVVAGAIRTGMVAGQRGGVVRNIHLNPVARYPYYFDRHPIFGHSGTKACARLIQPAVS